jgi:Zn ribbon nucleic-acid-binding protein
MSPEHFFDSNARGKEAISIDGIACTTNHEMIRLLHLYKLYIVRLTEVETLIYCPQCSELDNITVHIKKLDAHCMNCGLNFNLKIPCHIQEKKIKQINKKSN